MKLKLAESMCWADAAAINKEIDTKSTAISKTLGVLLSLISLRPNYFGLSAGIGAIRGIIADMNSVIRGSIGIRQYRLRSPSRRLKVCSRLTVAS